MNTSTTSQYLAALRRTCLLAACFACGAANAHIALDQPTAAAGSTYKAVLRVGHGCDGTATTGLAVRIPAGFKGAKPQPKPGWTLAVRREKLAATEEVVEIRWTAASRESALPDSQFDEFALAGRLPEQAGPLWFKVTQTCESGQIDWSQVPAEGTATKGLKQPAVLLEVTPAGHEHHSH